MGAYPFCADADFLSHDQQRVMDKVEKDASGCWIWNATRDTRGYGRIGSGGKPVSAHRFSYVVFRGPIATGLVLDHLCRVPSCVNPWHLEQVTHKENILRGVGHAAVNAKKTHCDKGHPLSGKNLKFQPGGRASRECGRIADRAFKWRTWLTTVGGAQ